MIYIPKYKTGETVISNFLGEDSYDHELIIIGSWITLYKHSVIYCKPSVDFDESCTEKVCYGTYFPFLKRTWWIGEKYLESYCVNYEKGKRN